jgi:signal transduction histidine kinase
LLECLTADDVAGLRSQLHHGRALDDVPVAFAAGGAAARKGMLRARAITDAAGAFAGYVGTLRESADAAVPAGGVAAAPGPTAPRVAGGAGAAAATAAAADSDHESFSFTVSHDLRAPIRVVEGFTKIIKEDYGRALDRVGNDHLDRVLGAAARMNNMIDALLALSKLSSQPLACQPVNLSQLAGYVADDLHRHWPERDVQLHIEPDMQVLGDPTLLRVVIENLLGNAWKYTAKVGTAQIAFVRDPKDAAAFSVSDNGAGFDMRFADRLFGVFQRLHSANDFPGTGVGLASVRRIVRRHGGEIWGEGEVNRGARFHFTLPQGSAVP